MPCGLVYKRQSWLIIGLGGLARLWETTSLDRGIWTTQESLLSMVQDTGFLHDFCFHSRPEFLPWQTVSWKWKLNKPFPPQAVSDPGAYHSNGKQTSSLSLGKQQQLSSSLTPRSGQSSTAGSVSVSIWHVILDPIRRDPESLLQGVPTLCLLWGKLVQSRGVAGLMHLLLSICFCNIRIETYYASERLYHSLGFTFVPCMALVLKQETWK